MKTTGVHAHAVFRVCFGCSALRRVHLREASTEGVVSEELSKWRKDRSPGRMEEMASAFLMQITEMRKDTAVSLRPSSLLTFHK